MELGFLEVHLQTKHGKATGGIRNWGTTPPDGEQHTYNIAFPTSGVPRNCPIKGCRGRAETQTAMQVQFLHWHVQDTVIIPEEGNLPNPRCPWCNMLVPWRDLNRWHLSTAQCAKGAERKLRRMAEEEMWESAERDFQDYRRPLDTITSLKIWGRS